MGLTFYIDNYGSIKKIKFQLYFYSQMSWAIFTKLLYFYTKA